MASHYCMYQVSFIGLDQLSYKLGLMEAIPVYSKSEEKAYLAAKKDHTLCDRFGIENYVFRITKNWIINIGIIVSIFFN